MSIKAIELTQEELIVEIPCQFGIINTFTDHPAEFSHKGIVRTEKHPFLPPFFWDYTVVDEKEQIIFTTRPEIRELKINTAIDDYFGDGNQGRVDCLITAHDENIPAGMVLSGDRDLHDHYARQLIFRRNIENVPMVWTHIAKADKSEEYFTIHFGREYGGQDDTIHLRSFTPQEKNVIKAGYEFGLFFSSQLNYPIGEDKGLWCELTTCYPIKSPFEFSPKDFPLCKHTEISFGQASWINFDPYRQQGDVFIRCSSVDREIQANEAARKPLEELITEISCGAPRRLSWEVFRSLFDFQRKYGIVGKLYGEHGALRIERK